jgi:hypothetical protein
MGVNCTMVFRIFASLLLGFGLLSGASFAQSPTQSPGPSAEITDSDRETIKTIIQGQEDALKRDDGAAAFGFASPMIRDMFGTPDNFMSMVRQGYPMVYRPRSFEFSGLAFKNGVPTQKVRIVGPDGKRHNAFYPMTQLPDGTWRIDGCYLEPTDENQV